MIVDIINESLTNSVNYKGLYVKLVSATQESWFIQARLYKIQGLFKDS